eukprot:2045802-Prymnesium_polylepis.1
MRGHEAGRGLDRSRSVTTPGPHARRSVGLRMMGPSYDAPGTTRNLSRSRRTCLRAWCHAVRDTQRV